MTYNQNTRSKEATLSFAKQWLGMCGQLEHSRLILAEQDLQRAALTPRIVYITIQSNVIQIKVSNEHLM